MQEEQEKDWAWRLSVCIVWGVVGLIVVVIFATMTGLLAGLM
jgi:hypothetical protein